MKPRFPSIVFATALLAGRFGCAVYGGTATDVTGLYYTGVNSTGGLLAGAAADSHWSVTYASVSGTDANYEGAAHVVSGSYIDAGWTQNTATAQWIVPPGAMTAATGGTANTGGDYLPGNGTTGSNLGIYVYTLAFNIVGTGTIGSTITNAVSISLTISADDQYSIYVNPSGNGATLPSGTAAASATSAWNNTTAATLQNGTNGTGTSGNAIFKLGINYLTIRVDNTNSKTGTSADDPLNPSGLLVYQVGAATLINGQPIPEVGTWLPLVFALGLYGVYAFGRSRKLCPIRVSV